MKTKQKTEKYPLKPPTLRAREQFLRVEKQYEHILERGGFGVKDIIRFLSAEDILRIQQKGDIDEEIIRKLLTKEEFLQQISQGFTPDEELEYTKALIDLATACVDWDATFSKPEDLWEETIDEVFRIILLFRQKIGRR